MSDYWYLENTFTGKHNIPVHFTMHDPCITVAIGTNKLILMPFEKKVLYNIIISILYNISPQPQTNVHIDE